MTGQACQYWQQIGGRSQPSRRFIQPAVVFIAMYGILFLYL